MNQRVNTVIDFGCISFCGLTSAVKISNIWVSPQAKFILEVNQGRNTLHQKLHNIQRRHTTCTLSIFCKMPLCYIHAILSEPCLSYAERGKNLGNNNKKTFRKRGERKRIYLEKNEMKCWQAFWDPCLLNL